MKKKKKKKNPPRPQLGTIQCFKLSLTKLCKTPLNQVTRIFKLGVHFLLLLLSIGESNLLKGNLCVGTHRGRGSWPWNPGSQRCSVLTLPLSYILHPTAYFGLIFCEAIASFPVNLQRFTTRHDSRGRGIIQRAQEPVALVSCVFDLCCPGCLHLLCPTAQGCVIYAKSHRAAILAYEKFIFSRHCCGKEPILKCTGDKLLSK